MKRILTHQQPDGDAIAAAWLIERYLFTDEPTEVVFVSRSYSLSSPIQADAVVDITGTHDPARLAFDHKPPAFSDRNKTCATKLVWEYLLTLGKPVHHLKLLVTAVHEGDHRPPRVHAPAFAQSRKVGFHAQLVRARQVCNDDRQLYAAMKAWLTAYDIEQKAAKLKEETRPERCQ